MISLPVGRVRETGANFNDGRVARGSKKVLKRIDGNVSRPVPPSCLMASPAVAERARVMSSVPANPTLMLDVVWKGKADASSGCLSDGVPAAAALPPNDELDRPSGWARVGTR
jgi:hypothetical protein